MSDLTCQIVTRKIYAYVAEIYGTPTFWDDKWCPVKYMLTWLRYTGRPRFGMTSGVLWFMYFGGIMDAQYAKEWY